MKILLLDDKGRDDAYRKVFVTEWGLNEREADVLVATDDQEALRLLRDTSIGLVVLDLLWDTQPEHVSAVPLGLEYLKVIRRYHPNIEVISRSVIRDPHQLANLVAQFVQLRVQHHFITGDLNPHAALRRRVVLQAIEEAFVGKQEDRKRTGLREHVGDRWAAVLFGDVSGYTSMTEQTWWRCREKLWNAMDEFYEMGIESVVRHGGTVDKLIGDEVMAVFVETNEVPKEAIAKRAADAARQIINLFREVERKFKKSITDEPDALRGVNWQIKVGLEAGSIIVREKILPNGESEFCVLGPAVNLASRIKGLAGDYGIALGKTVRDRLPQGGYETQLVKEASELKGLAGTLEIYKLMP